MADLIPFESPVTKTYDFLQVGPGKEAEAPLTLSDLSSTGKTILRADPSAADRVGVGFGASVTVGDVLVCGQRPGEWMLIGPIASAQALVDGLGLDGFHSVVIHTHSRALFRLTGERAASALEKVCSLDWSDDMTPDGAAASATVARVTCDIIRNDDSGARSYLIACDRSFGQYLFDALIDAGWEFAITVTPWWMRIGNPPSR